MSTKSLLGNRLYLFQLLHSCLDEDSKLLTVEHDKHGFSLKTDHSFCCQMHTGQLKNLSNATEQERSSKNVIDLKMHAVDNESHFEGGKIKRTEKKELVSLVPYIWMVG